MKTRSSVKKRCNKCHLLKRNGKLIVICTKLKHKQKQG